MATKFIILAQVHRQKTSISTRKPHQFNRNKSKSSKSVTKNMLNNVFSGKRLTEIYHDNLNPYPHSDSLLFVEERPVKEEETTQQEHMKMSWNCDRKDDGKSISATDYRELRCEVARLSLFWYMRSSISYMLRKARAFYNEFCCDTYAESNNTMSVVDPYFAVPVLPFNNY